MISGIFSFLINIKNPLDLKTNKQTQTFLYWTFNIKTSLTSSNCESFLVGDKQTNKHDWPMVNWKDINCSKWCSLSPSLSFEYFTFYFCWWFILSCWRCLLLMNLEGEKLTFTLFDDFVNVSESLTGVWWRKLCSWRSRETGYKSLTQSY